MIAASDPLHLKAVETANVDREYRRHRRSVYAGIFVGYAAYYLVRNNLALAIPDILQRVPAALEGRSRLGADRRCRSAYGISKFLMGSVSDRSNPKYFLPLGLLLSCAHHVRLGHAKAIYASLALVIVLQIANGWVQGMGWPPCGKTMVHWFSTKERGLVVSIWNVAPQRRRRPGGDLRALRRDAVPRLGREVLLQRGDRRGRRRRRLLPDARHAGVVRPAAGRGIQERLPAGLQRRRTSGRSPTARSSSSTC